MAPLARELLEVHNMDAAPVLSERMGRRDGTLLRIVNDDRTTQARDAAKLLDELTVVRRVSGIHISKGREPTKSNGDSPDHCKRSALHWFMDMKHFLSDNDDGSYKRADKAKRSAKQRERSEEALVLQHKQPRAPEDDDFDDDDSAYDADVDEAKYVQIVYEEASI